MECQVRDLTMHYEEAGTGRPLLILHGWTMTGAQTMDHFEPSFQNRPGWRRLYPDIPGHGKTPLPDWLRDHDGELEMLLEFMDAVAPGERFVVAGLSWGGYLARGVLHHRAKQIDGVMLYVPVIKLIIQERDLPAKHALRHDAQFVAGIRPDEGWLLDVTVAQSLSLLDEVRSKFIAFAIPHDPLVEQIVYKTPFSFDPDGLPEPCTAPALFLMGRQDHWCGYMDAWKVLDNFPRGTFAVLDRAGHMLNYEQRPLAQALMSEWLDRVEEYIAQNAP